MKEQELRKLLKTDFPSYAKACLKIQQKSGGLVPFNLNRAQHYIHEIAEKQKKEKGFVRIIVCKGRQQGCSSYIEGRFYWLTTHTQGIKAFILTHETEATSNLFDMVKRFHDNCPEPFRPATGANSANELFFEKLDSGYKVGTAGNKSVGRSATIQLLHSSESAYQPNAESHSAGLLQAVPREPGTEVWVESTAAGENDYFHNQWKLAVKGESEFIPVFVPWFWQPEYTITPENFSATQDELELANTFGLTEGQLAWRRLKIRELGGASGDGIVNFLREYPNTPSDAFAASQEQRVIPTKLIRPAVNRDVSPILNVKPTWGVDVGGEGADSDASVLCKRQGNVLLEKPISWKSKDPMQVAGLVLRAYDLSPVKPGRINIDSIGIGSGVVARLKEYEHLSGVVFGVNVSEASSISDICHKLRDELWWRSRLWFEAGDTKIPEGCENLITELSSPLYDYNSSGKVVVESKKDMKKRGVASPNEADAFNLTFASSEIPMVEVFQRFGGHRYVYDPQKNTQTNNPHHQIEWKPD